MAYKEKSKVLQLRYSLKRVNRQTNEAIFTLWDDKEAIGTLRIYHRKIVDQSKRMGSLGYIRDPKQGHFPERIVIKELKTGA